MSDCRSLISFYARGMPDVQNNYIILDQEIK